MRRQKAQKSALCFLCFFVANRARVALQADQFRALHRTAPVTFRISLRCELKNFIEISIDVSVARSKTRLSGSLFKTVPRTNILADVAAIQPTRKVLFKLTGQFRRPQFDSPVRNAFVGIDNVRLGNRLCRTSIDAKRARSAVILYLNTIAIEFQVQQQLTDKDPRTMLGRDHIRMLAQPSQSRTYGPCFIHYWLYVDTHFSISVRLLVANPRKQ